MSKAKITCTVTQLPKELCKEAFVNGGHKFRDNLYTRNTKDKLAYMLASGNSVHPSEIQDSQVTFSRCPLSWDIEWTEPDPIADTSSHAPASALTIVYYDAKAK